MITILDLNKQILVDAVGSNSAIATLVTKRSSAGLVAVQLVQNGEPVVEAMGGEFALKFTAKTKGKFDEDPPVVSTGDFTWDATLKVYIATVNWNVPPINTALVVDGNPDNDQLVTELDVEVGWRYDSANPYTPSENRVILTLRNNVNRETDGAPVDPEALAALVWLKENAVIYSGIQLLAPTDMWQALNNLGWTLDLDLSIIKITLPDGSFAAIPVTAVPTL